MAGGEISMCICLAGVAAIIAVYGDRFDTNVSAGNGAVFLSECTESRSGTSPDDSLLVHHIFRHDLGTTTLHRGIRSVSSRYARQGNVGILLHQLGKSSHRRSLADHR